jgi:phospholipase C
MRLRIGWSGPGRVSAFPVVLIVSSLVAIFVLAFTNHDRAARAASVVQADTGTTQWITNQSVESVTTGWAGSYNATSATSRVSPGFDGSFSLRSVNKTTKTGVNGFSDKPRWISGSGTSATVAGTVYTGSVWVKADVAGEKISLFLRELNRAGAPVNKAPNNVSVTATAKSTGWFNLTQAYPAVAGGDAISFIVYASNVPAGKGFDADLMSLTSPAPTAPVLGAPTNLHATSVSGTEVDLAWTPAAGAASYTIQRDGVAIGTTTATQFADTTVNASRSYSYVVIATDSFGGSAPGAALQVDTGDVTPPPPPPPPPPPTLCGNAAPATPVAIQHVLIVMLENHSYNQVVGASAAPNQTGLAAKCGNATAMFAATHASAANYLAMSAGEFPAGSAKGCGSVSACADASDNLYHQLDVAGLSWRAYEESMPQACSPSTVGSYKIGHNPPIFYRDIPPAECQANDIPVPSLTDQSGPFWNDLQAQTLPALSWITPNTVNDGDTGTPTAALAAADKWLAAFLATVQQSASYQAGNTLVLVTYDEGTGSDSNTGEDCTNQTLDLPITSGVSAHQDSCHVPLFVVYPYTPAGSADAAFFDHYSLTKTVEELFGLPLIAHAADTQTTSLRGHFGIS